MQRVARSHQIPSLYFSQTPAGFLTVSLQSGIMHRAVLGLAGRTGRLPLLRPRGLATCRPASLAAEKDVQ